MQRLWYHDWRCTSSYAICLQASLPGAHEYGYFASLAGQVEIVWCSLECSSETVIYYRAEESIDQLICQQSDAVAFNFVHSGVLNCSQGASPILSYIREALAREVNLDLPWFLLNIETQSTSRRRSFTGHFFEVLSMNVKLYSYSRRQKIECLFHSVCPWHMDILLFVPNWNEKTLHCGSYFLTISV